MLLIIYGRVHFFLLFLLIKYPAVNSDIYYIHLFYISTHGTQSLSVTIESSLASLP